MTLVTPRKLAVFVAVVGFAVFLYLVGGDLITWEPGKRANFWILAIAAAAAIWYALLTHQIRRADHTPILTAVYRDGRTVIRNNGKGAALNCSLTNDQGGLRLTLGDIPPGEEGAFTQNVGWSITESNYLFYQDVFGRWYATKSLARIVANAANVPITNPFQGRIFNPPSEAARHADTQSAFEYMLQAGHWWTPRNWTRWIKYYSRRRWIAFQIMRKARAAVERRALVEPFNANEFAQVVDWPTVVAERFMRTHRVGNEDQEREYFIGSPEADRYSINRRVRP